MVPDVLHSRKAFTLIELLVVIAIIAILSVVVILTLNPAELLRQSRDANRLSDLDTISHAVALYSTDQSSALGFSLGSASTTYISIPDPLATSTAGDQCQGLGFTSFPTSTGYSYHCAASSTFRNTDGTGWLPINLKNISSGSPLGNLPVDPVNQSSSSLFYTYTTDGTKYELTSIVESQKYKLQLINNPPILGYPEVAAAGSNLSLSELYNPMGLVGYWPLNEGSGSSTQDVSGSNTVGTWFGTASGNNSTYYTANAKVGASTGYLNGSNNYISLGNPTALQITNAITASIWVNESAPANWLRIISNSFQTSTLSGPFVLEVANSNNAACYINGGAGGVASPSNTFSSGVWNYLTCSYSGSVLTLYINGVAMASSSVVTTLSYTNAYPWVLGAQMATSSANSFFNGAIDDARIYNRALSAPEVQALYSAEK